MYASVRIAASQRNTSLGGTTRLCGYLWKWPVGLSHALSRAILQKAHALEVMPGAAVSEDARAALRAGEAAKRRLLISNHPFLVKLASQFANQVSIPASTWQPAAFSGKAYLFAGERRRNTSCVLLVGKSVHTWSAYGQQQYLCTHSCCRALARSDLVTQAGVARFPGTVQSGWCCTS